MTRALLNGFTKDVQWGRGLPRKLKLTCNLLALFERHAKNIRTTASDSGEKQGSRTILETANILWRGFQALQRVSPHLTKKLSHGTEESKAQDVGVGEWKPQARDVGCSAGLGSGQISEPLDEGLPRENECNQRRLLSGKKTAFEESLHEYRL